DVCSSDLPGAPIRPGFLFRYCLIKPYGPSIGPLRLSGTCTCTGSRGIFCKDSTHVSRATVCTFSSGFDVHVLKPNTCRYQGALTYVAYALVTFHIESCNPVGQYEVIKSTFCSYPQLQRVRFGADILATTDQGYVPTGRVRNGYRSMIIAIIIGFYPAVTGIGADAVPVFAA